jgi:hypothetical protein
MTGRGKRVWTIEQRRAISERSRKARQEGKIPEIVLTSDRPDVNTWKGVKRIG